jgi:hypothetical protein
MRLVRIMPHDTRAQTEVRTYACKCGHEIEQTVDL